MKTQDEKGIENTFTRRTIVMGAVGGAAFAVLAARLQHIQVRQSERYALLSEDNQFNYRLLTPSRGRLLDRFGAPLAENEENYAVLIVPENAKDVSEVLERLSRIVPLTDAEKESVLREVSRTPGFRSVSVADNLDWRQFAQVNLDAPNLPGVLPVVRETRVYPLGTTFAHLTGYVGKADEKQAGNDPLLRDPTFRIGREGLERALESSLRGEAGSLKVEVNAFGRVVRELPDPATAAKPGEDVMLTLDAGLQQRAIDVLAEERCASAAVIDVQNGDVLALASNPAYDPNHFARGMSTAEYRSLSTDERNPLFPWAFAGEYPPGSTFKPMVAMAAARHGVIGPNDRVYCGGSIRVGSGRKHCWSAHGSVDLHGALKGSCDIYFYEVGRRLGIDRIAEVAREFGLGSAPDLPLPGVRPGLIPDEAWKRSARGEPWYPGETLNAAIGQGDVLATPLQLALMTARIATRRKVMPRMVLGGEAPAPFEELNYDEEALEHVRLGMFGVCEEPGGTAYNSLGRGLNLDGMKMAGKSGTSQVAGDTRGISGERLPWARRDHALFIGFAPYDAPRYACAAVVQHGIAGSRVAGPMVKALLVHALETNSGRDPQQLASLGR